MWSFVWGKDCWMYNQSPTLARNGKNLGYIRMNTISIGWGLLGRCPKTNSWGLRPKADNIIPMECSMVLTSGIRARFQKLAMCMYPRIAKQKEVKLIARAIGGSDLVQRDFESRAYSRGSWVFESSDSCIRREFESSWWGTHLAYSKGSWVLESPDSGLDL